MNRGVLVLILLQSLWGGKFGLEAQGVVNFANIGGGVNAPFSGPNGLLGSGYIAGLRTVSGTMVGAWAPFLANGLFSAGLREVQNHPPGSTVELELVIEGFDSFMWVSQPFEVVLGDRENPGRLTGLESATVGGVVYGFEICDAPYCWSVDTFDGTGVDCILGGGIAAHVSVDDCFCARIPYPGDPERVIVPCGQETDGGISFSLKPSGDLELRWPVGKNLVRSREPGGKGREPVGGASTESGTRIRTFKTSESQFFFWLEE